METSVEETSENVQETGQLDMRVVDLSGASGLQFAKDIDDLGRLGYRYWPEARVFCRPAPAKQEAAQ